MASGCWLFQKSPAVPSTARIGFSTGRSRSTFESSNHQSSSNTKKTMATQKTKQDLNKEIVGRWFTHFWGKKADLSIVDELAAPNMLLKYSLHEPRKGHDDIKAFM